MLALEFAENVTTDPMTPANFPKFLVAPDEESLVAAATDLMDGLPSSVDPCVLVVVRGEMLDLSADEPDETCDYGQTLAFIGKVRVVS